MGHNVPQPHGGAVYQADPGETRNPHGRPPLTLTGVLRELKAAGYERVTRAGVMEAYELLMSLDEEKLKEKIVDKKQPMIVRIVGKAMLEKDGKDMLERMLDRAHGRPTQGVDVTTGGKSLFGIETELKHLYDQSGENTEISVDTVQGRIGTPDKIDEDSSGNIRDNLSEKIPASSLDVLHPIGEELYSGSGSVDADSNVS